jgi:hypothetical protein
MSRPSVLFSFLWWPCSGLPSSYGSSLRGGWRSKPEPSVHRQSAAVVFVAVRWTSPADSRTHFDPDGNHQKAGSIFIVGRVLHPDRHGGVSNLLGAARRCRSSHHEAAVWKICNRGNPDPLGRRRNRAAVPAGFSVRVVSPSRPGCRNRRLQISRVQ